MRAKVAKAIRKSIYQGEKEEPVKDRGYIEVFGGTFLSTEKRRKYTLAKKEYKHLKHSGKLNGG